MIARLTYFFFYYSKQPLRANYNRFMVSLPFHDVFLRGQPSPIAFVSGSQKLISECPYLTMNIKERKKKKKKKKDKSCFKSLLVVGKIQEINFKKNKKNKENYYLV